MTESHQLQAFLDGAQVAPEIFQLRPDYRVLLIAVDGITPGPSNDVSETILRQAEDSARAELAIYPVTEIPHVAAWRKAYQAFGAKPARTRNSLEALLRRLESGLPRVNALTDVYNAISIKHRIPLGGEDLHKYSGPARCLRATGEETFEAVSSGMTTVEHPDVGEAVWCDDAGVTCRRWNWRQTRRTVLTEDTTAALFIIDALEPVSDSELYAAADELTSALEQLGLEIHVVRRIIRAPPEQ
jgi:DNA/RNA-binding domain of Phe-tRNA-synthetase-like protein